MNYELALELKDAGFPQVTFDALKPHLGHYAALIDGRVRAIKDGTFLLPQDAMVYIPTLSEIIEACLRRNDKVGDKPSWLKLICANPEPSSSILTFGIQAEAQAVNSVTYYKSPEEAVAILWLALNKK